MTPIAPAPTATAPATGIHPLIGVDIKFVDGVTQWGDGLSALRTAAEQGFDGVNVRTIDELSPTLDPGELRDFAQLSRELGLYVEMGVGKVNPYMTAELPRVRALGEGSYLAGMQRMIEACAEHGWLEAWTAVGGFKPYRALYATDRFRTDTDWTAQLAATERFLQSLAPVLRDNGVHLDLESHEEITSFELLRLIDAVGDDVLGVCLDPANLAVRGELPNEGIRRLAPHVRSTQLRDIALWEVNGGLSRFLAPCGQGLIDWDDALEVLLGASPALHLTIEGIGAVRAEMTLHPDDGAWLAGHPDLVPDELARLRAQAADYERRAIAGDVETLDELRALRPDRQAHDAFVADSAMHLRTRIAELRARAAAATTTSSNS